MVSFDEDPCVETEGFGATLRIHQMIEEVLAELHRSDSDSGTKRDSMRDTFVDF